MLDFLKKQLFVVDGMKLTVAGALAILAVGYFLFIKRR
jgi:hypothetical protein